MPFLYFAYGSNLLRERILVNNPSAVFAAVAKLPNYKLQFSVKSDWSADKNDLRWKGGVCTIVQSEGDEVWGVVWKLEESDQANLDRQEGVHTGEYRRLDSMTVTTAEDASSMDCFTYQLMEPVPVATPPSPHYLKVVQTGALQHNLPVEYRQLLDSIQHNGYEGPLPLFDEVMKNVKL